MSLETVAPSGVTAETNDIEGLGQVLGPRDYFALDDEARTMSLLQIMRPDGSVADDDVAGVSRESARELYHGMLTIRVTDKRMMALQRQGRIGFYGEALGQEAACVGSAAAMQKDDWLVPALREAGAGLYRGLSLESYIAQIYGNDNDVSRGRQMPCHPCDRETNYVVMSSCVGSQIPHAVGIAMAMKINGDGGRACVGYMGDGATSEADFHVAINFAGVMKAPVVLICQNNQWAISTPGSVQTAAPTIACKAIGYGVDAIRVDGNDVLAVHDACRRALAKARMGQGPTFLELLTYRIGAHSSSDDPSRYRDESITDTWKSGRDPLARMRAFLLCRDWLSPSEDEDMANAIETRVREVIDQQEACGAPPKRSLIEDVYETPTWRQEEQFRDLEGE